MKQNLKITAILLFAGIIAVFASGCVDNGAVEEIITKIEKTIRKITCSV
ncbi:outer membrane lipoprotein-sorting protein [Methanohalophilus levihalophilus]|nr:hypothetical protein [Methanohalophilus levihalophilus]MBP2031068.1 outer membrane lipoprotein-sorting protein [Methanohalophilus levihalophilus]